MPSAEMSDPPRAKHGLCEWAAKQISVFLTKCKIASWAGENPMCTQRKDNVDTGKGPVFITQSCKNLVLNWSQKIGAKSFPHSVCHH